MAKRVTDGRVKWETVLFSEWYGHKEKEMLITSRVAIWYKSNTVMVKVKWVLIKDPEGERGKKIPTLPRRRGGGVLTVRKYF